MTEETKRKPAPVKAEKPAAAAKKPVLKKAAAKKPETGSTKPKKVKKTAMVLNTRNGMVVLIGAIAKVYGAMDQLKTGNYAQIQAKLKGMASSTIYLHTATLVRNELVVKIEKDGKVVGIRPAPGVRVTTHDAAMVSA